jgi:hypothetical protein
MTDSDYPVPEPDPEAELDAEPVDDADGGDPYPPDRPVAQDDDREGLGEQP